MFLSQNTLTVGKVEEIVDERISTLDTISRDDVVELIAEAQLDPVVGDVYLKKDDAAVTYATINYVDTEISKIPSGGGDVSKLTNGSASLEFTDNDVLQVVMPGNRALFSINAGGGSDVFHFGLIEGHGSQSANMMVGNANIAACSGPDGTLYEVGCDNTKINGTLETTGNLTAPNIYTKTEVDSLIASASGGGGGGTPSSISNGKLSLELENNTFKFVSSPAGNFDIFVTDEYESPNEGFRIHQISSGSRTDFTMGADPFLVEGQHTFNQNIDTKITSAFGVPSKLTIEYDDVTIPNLTVNGEADKRNIYTKTEVDSLIASSSGGGGTPSSLSLNDIHLKLVEGLYEPHMEINNPDYVELESPTSHVQFRMSAAGKAPLKLRSYSAENGSETSSIELGKHSSLNSERYSEDVYNETLTIQSKRVEIISLESQVNVSGNLTLDGSLTVNDVIKSSKSGHRLGNLEINSPYLRYWKDDLHTADDKNMYFQIGRSNADDSDSFWMHYTYPGQMKFKFYGGGSTDFLSMDKSTQTTKIYSDLQLDKNLTVNGNTNISTALKVGKLEIVPSGDTYVMCKLNDEYLWSGNSDSDDMVIYKKLNVRQDLSVSTNATISGNLYVNGKQITGNETVTHHTNVQGQIGTFCETNGGIYDGYENIGETDCICQVVQSSTLNSKIVGIITSETEFASHGDVLMKVVPGTYKLGDILCPDITGLARVATETELQYMVLHAIPRPKITSLATGIENTVACFIV